MVSRKRKFAAIFIFTSTLLLAGTPAAAENWIESPSDADGIHEYYDADSIQQIGKMVRIKAKLVIPQIDLTKLAAFDFDCSKGRYQEYLVADDGKVTSKIGAVKPISESDSAKRFSSIACKAKHK